MPPSRCWPASAAQACHVFISGGGTRSRRLLAIPRQRTAASGFAALVDTYFRPPPGYTSTPDRRSRWPMHAPLTPPSTVQRNEKNRRALRPFSIAVVAAVLLMQAQYAHAQHASAPAGP